MIERNLVLNPTDNWGPVVARMPITVAHGGDVENLPPPLFKRLLEMAALPHTYLPMTAFAQVLRINILSDFVANKLSGLGAALK